MGGNWMAVLILAFGLGMLRALDADHIMAVSGVAGTRALVALSSIGFGTMLLHG